MNILVVALKLKDFPGKGDIKCSIRPNELLVGAELLHPSGLIQILLNNHKFLKCETSAQNVSFLSQNHFCIFSRSPRNTPLISVSSTDPMVAMAVTYQAK